MPKIVDAEFEPIKALGRPAQPIKAKFTGRAPAKGPPPFNVERWNFFNAFITVLWIGWPFAVWLAVVLYFLGRSSA
jgi:hypothetical protein